MQELKDGENYLDLDKLHFIEALSRLRMIKKIPPERRNTRRKIENPIVLKIEWHKCMLEEVPLMKIMKEAKDFPAGHEPAKDRFIIAKKLRRTTGDRICNYRKAAKEVESRTDFDDWNDCPCRKLFDRKYRPGHHCMLTMDTTIARNKTLIKLLNEGTRYRQGRHRSRFSSYTGRSFGWLR